MRPHAMLSRCDRHNVAWGYIVNQPTPRRFSGQYLLNLLNSTHWRSARDRDPGHAQHSLVAGYVAQGASCHFRFVPSAPGK